MDSNWYKSLKQPQLTPPDWIFAPVWTVLYLSMLVSFILMVKDGNISAKISQIGLFMIQLALNLLWPDLFFARHMIFAAMVDIIILLVFIILTIISFWKVSPLAGAILIPYLLWVSFASYLNYQICVLNLFGND